MSNDCNGSPPIHRMMYRDVLIEVYMDKIGGTCCGLEHDLNEMLCINCKNPLKPKTVYLIALNGTFMPGFRPETMAEAINVAMSWIDRVHEHADNINEQQEKDSEDFAEDDQDDEGDDCEDDENDDDDDDEDRPIELANPPGAGKNWGGDDMSAIISQMTKLKWFERALNIVSERSKKSS
jgi:hypothetical protein